MNVAVAYCRVSTKEQVETLSLPTQRAACREYCERNDLQLAATFVDEGESAKTANRPEFKKLITYCSSHLEVDVVVVHSLSRFSRNGIDHHAVRAMLQSFGVQLRSVTEPIDESPIGKLMEGMIATISEFENNVKSANTRRGMTTALQQGRWTFKAPIGYLQGTRHGPSLVPDPDVAPHLRRAFEWAAGGGVSKREIVKRLTALGVRTKRGTPLTPQQLNEILKKPIYAGRIVVDSYGVQTTGDFEAIVPWSLYERVQAMFGTSPNRVPHSRDRPDFPLRRFVRCSSCDRPLTGSESKNHAKKKYAYYRCPNNCGVSAPREKLEQMFVEYLRSLTPSPRTVKLFRAIVVDTWQDRHKEAASVRADLQAQIDNLNEKKRILTEAHLYRRSIDAETFQEENRRIQEQRALVRLELNDATADEIDLEGLLDFAELFLLNPDRVWNQAATADRVRLQWVLFPEGMLFDGTELGTTLTAKVFSHLRESDVTKEGMVSPTGFEPVSPA